MLLFVLLRLGGSGDTPCSVQVCLVSVSFFGVVLALKHHTFSVRLGFFLVFAGVLSLGVEGMYSRIFRLGVGGGSGGEE